MANEIRVGMIGADTSHCIAFTKLLNNAPADGPHGGVKVVSCYPSFSADVANSVGRVDKFKKELSEKWSVRLVDSIAALLADVDAVLLESVDGRRHLKEFEPVARAGKPVFIDKPFTASLRDAKAIVKIAKETKVPCFSCSSLRYDSNIAKASAESKESGKIIGCDAFSPAHLEPTNPGLFWYGIHGVEILYTIMGTGCQSVACTSRPDGDMVIGTWRDDRLGTYRGIRKGKSGYGAMVLREKAPPQMVSSAGDYYAGLVTEVVKFFKTKQAPLPIEETLEICAYIDAAARSAASGGCEVRLDL
jgi:predicted dehydrogenase